MKSFYRSAALFFALTVCGSLQAFSQTSMRSKEAYFWKLYSKLTSFHQQDVDSISFYSEKFEKEFTSFIKSHPSTLDYSFKDFALTSGDGNFRIYDWDAWTGGTMHIFKTIYQWRSNGKVFTKTTEDDPGSSCSDIFTVYINHKPYYLATKNGIYSTKDHMESISAYTIEGNKLIDTVKLFKAKTKMLRSIEVQYDFFSVVDSLQVQSGVIAYDEKRKIIYIPVVDGQEQVTKKNLVYEFKGSYFEFVGIETGRRK